MYKLTHNSDTVTRLADNAFIPADNGNRDYREYQEWLEAGNTPEPADQPAPVNPLDAAEAHIAAHFSTPRLLQMKVWLDTFPAEDSPKLREVYDWTSAITIQAAQGQTTFSEPPHTFAELVAEAMGILGVAP